MSPEQRNQAARHFWAGSPLIGSAERDEAFALIAKIRGSREKTIHRASIDQLSSWLSNILPVPESIADALIRAFLLSEHREMIIEFVLSLGIPHTEGLVQNDFDPSLVSDDALITAATHLTAHFGQELTDLYFRHVAAQQGAWAEAVGRIPTNPCPGSALFPIEDPIKIEQVNPGEDRLTNLDRLLGQAIAATVVDSDGALDSEQIEDVIQEVLQANPQRDKTYYHKGYLDVLLKYPLKPHFREDNRDRRLWYLTGAISALEERGDHAGILQIFESENLRDLGRERKHRSTLAVGPIFKALCQEKGAAAAVAFLEAEMIWYGDLFHWTLEWATSLLRQQEFESASRLFDLLNSAVHGLSQVQIASLGSKYFDLERRRSHCLRFQRHFRAATEILMALLDAEAPPERSAMIVDIALMKEGFRGLLDVVIPSEQALRSFVHRLEGIRPQFEAAFSAGGDTGHASYCLGVLSIAKQVDPERAAEWLDTSVTNMVRHSNSYDLGNFLNHAKFYMGLARAEAISPSFVEKARVLFEESVNAGFTPPDHLLRRYIYALNLSNPDAARRAVETTLSNLGRTRVLEDTLDLEAVWRSEPILAALLESATNGKGTGRNRFRNLKRILEKALAGSHIVIAAAALDGMEQLARAGIQPEEFLELLRDPASFYPAWSSSDATWSSLGLYELAGKYVEARSALEQEFHRALAERRHGFLGFAEDILDKMRQLGADECDSAALKRRLVDAGANFFPDLRSLTLNHIPVQVTVVGGDERQARYDEAVVNEILGQLGNVHVAFRHTGWGGNWGPQFDAMRPVLDRSDVVVVMRLIRTNLGRRVREYAGLWVGCAGDSKSSIERAIRLGVGLVRKEKSS